MTSVDVFGISDFAILIYTWGVFVVLCQMINIFGIVTNIINIICFMKQGFEESVNISLLGLAVADLGSLLTMLLVCISMTPSFMAADLPFDPVEVTYLTSGMTHWAFTRVSGCLTAMITLERMLCITAPLKIKSLITPKRSTVITVCVFIIFFCTSAPMYFVNKLGIKLDPIRNKTLVGLISTKDRGQVEMVSFAINNFCIPFGSFVIIIVSTAILSFKLRSQTKWRQKTITSSQVDRVSSRSQKVGKMVVMISSLFILCFVPVAIMMLAIGLLPELSINGKFFKITVMLFGLGYLLEGVNSSMNIFIYYKMSSKYRTTFPAIFCMIIK